MADPKKSPVLLADGFTAEQMENLKELVKGAKEMPKDAVVGYVTAEHRRARVGQVVESFRTPPHRSGGR